MLNTMPSPYIQIKNYKHRHTQISLDLHSALVKHQSCFKSFIDTSLSNLIKINCDFNSLYLQSQKG